MPIYEYVCSNCSHHFDVLQKISDEPIMLCPKCQTESVIKQVSAAGFQLKGTGWYATDFKSKPRSTPSSEENKKTEAKSVEPEKAPSQEKSSKGEA